MTEQIEEILEDFRIHLFESGRVSSKMTTESYLGNIKQLLEWLEEEKMELGNLDRMLMMKYLEYLKVKQYRPNTYNTKINSITNFNSYLKEKGIIERDIIFGKDKIGLSGNREVGVYSEAEIKLIEAYIESDGISPRDKLLVKMLMELGVRVSELTNLRLEDIDVVGLQVEVQGKNNKRRTLPIKSNLASDISSYISKDRKNSKHSSSPYLFVSERANKLHRNTVLAIVKKMGKELEIEEAYCHKFRHTLATNMSRNKVPIQVIQQFLGHSEIQTSIDFYVNVDTHQLKQALESI